MKFNNLLYQYSKNVNNQSKSKKQNSDFLHKMSKEEKINYGINLSILSSQILLELGTISDFDLIRYERWLNGRDY